MPKDLRGCKVCRVRKKACPGPENGTAGSCGGCNRLNIRCLQGYGKRVESRYRVPRLIAAIKRWTSVQANRTRPIKFCLEGKLREFGERASGMEIPAAGKLEPPSKPVVEEHQICNMGTWITAARGTPRPTIEGHSVHYSANRCNFADSPSQSSECLRYNKLQPPYSDNPGVAAYTVGDSNSINPLFLMRAPAPAPPQTDFLADDLLTIPYAISNTPTMHNPDGMTYPPDLSDSRTWSHGASAYLADDFPVVYRSNDRNQGHEINLLRSTELYREL